MEMTVTLWEEAAGLYLPTTSRVSSGHSEKGGDQNGEPLGNPDDTNNKGGGIGAGLAIVTSLGLGDYDSAYHSCLDLLASSRSRSQALPTIAVGTGHHRRSFDFNGLLASTIDPINTYVDGDNDASNEESEFQCGGGGGKWRALALLVLRYVYFGKPSLFRDYRPHLVFPADGLIITAKNSSTESLRFAKDVLDAACLNAPKLDMNTAAMAAEEIRSHEEARALWCAGMFLRASCMFYGIGTPKNKSGAVLLDLKCEPYGFVPTLASLGWEYDEGQGGVEKDFAKAFRYYLAAAESGYASSQAYLGLMYMNGRGAEQNLEEAFRWLQKSCEQESIYGYSKLALCFKFGKGVKKDEAEATRLLRLCVEQGDPWAQQKLALQPSVDPTESLSLLRLSAAQGDTLAQRELAEALQTGKGTTSRLPNPTLAVKFFKLAADKGDLTALERLGMMYLQGAGEEVPQQRHVAVRYFRQAANSGSLLAQNNLALCYHHGYGIPVDLGEAFRLYTLSATSGDRTAQFNVGVCYVMKEGAGTTRDVREALRWFRLAAQQCHAASFTVVKLVETGTDVLIALRTQISHT
ncbi:sel1 repeat family protein [Pelomyxa schiedti]|nr:sel1 repeat family protein [Pelomyxa schiedti]